MNNVGAFAGAAGPAEVIGASSPLCYTLSRVLLNCMLAKERVEMRRRECPKTSDLRSLPDRDREVRWMLAIGGHFRLGLSTLGLSVAILDRILRAVKVQGKYLNCVAVAALGLAVKFHEEVDADSETYEAHRGAAMLLAIPSPVPVNADALASKIRANAQYSQQEMNRMERTLLAQLQWDLLLPSFDRFLQAMLAVIGTPHLAASGVLRRNFEIVLSSGQLVWSYSASVLSLALLSTMLEFTGLEWSRITQSLRNIFQIDEISLGKCRRDTAELLRDHYWGVNKENNSNKYCLLPVGVRWIRPPPSPLDHRRPRRGKKQQRKTMPMPVAAAKHRRPAFGAAFLVQNNGDADENAGAQQGQQQEVC